ncbi:60S ribosomal protein L13-like [Agrilus planipennis]|uniref:Large ribosomal subunit protein eL13 n=1 Tax=Agrilus planipennis TaxID=224129 RepID=A0A7F5RAL4_AGRPL|nr:60S ribosomal protein L13-like [Agrilus planipennis]
MVRHNNTIPNNHFHKNWQKRVKTWFNQPAKKNRRRLNRDRRQKKLAPKPVDLLRPIVNCPSVRYNSKKRIGRGFTLREIKSAKIHPDYAKSIGIAVDYRRINKSAECLQQNVLRLKQYLAKLIVFPKGKISMPNEELVIKGVNSLSKPVLKIKAKVPSTEEKQFNAFITLRKARAEKRNLGRRIKRMKKAAQDIESGVSTRKMRVTDDYDD